MSEQQSKKRGVKSDAQKRATSHRQFQPTPASNPVAGAHGRRAASRDSDVDLSLKKNTGRASRMQRKRVTDQE
jgi:hypothetical protein